MSFNSSPVNVKDNNKPGYKVTLKQFERIPPPPFPFFKVVSDPQNNLQKNNCYDETNLNGGAGCFKEF